MIRVVLIAVGIGGAGLLTAAPAMAQPSTDVGCSPCDRAPGLLEESWIRLLESPAQTVGNIAAVPGQTYENFANLPGQAIGNVVGLPGQAIKNVRDLPGQAIGNIASLPGQAVGNIVSLPGQAVDNVRKLFVGDKDEEED